VIVLKPFVVTGKRGLPSREVASLRRGDGIKAARIVGKAGSHVKRLHLM
jgi:hypothetical protein